MLHGVFGSPMMLGWTTGKLAVGFWCKKLPVLVLYYMPLEWQLLVTYWAILKVEALTDPEPMTLCTPSPSTPWVIEPAPHNFSMASEVSSIQDANLSCRRAWPYLSLLPHQPPWWCKNPPLSPISLLATWGAPCNQLSQEHWEFVHYRRYCHHHRYYCFPSLNRDVHDRRQDKSISTIGQTSGSHLNTGCSGHLHIFINSWAIA